MATSLTPALEDYLATIYKLSRKIPYTRVGDIAKERDVRAASVTPALKRLSDLGYVDYEQRDKVSLTPSGERIALRVHARHVVFYRFFHELLGMEESAAHNEACGLEHVLSDEGLDRFVRFFEYIKVCPGVAAGLERMRTCQALNPHDEFACQSSCGDPPSAPFSALVIDVLTLAPFVEASVRQVRAEGDLRQQLLDKGFIPGVKIVKIPQDPELGGVRVRVHQTELSLSDDEASSLLVVPTFKKATE